MERSEILNEIMKCHIEFGERLDDMASHSLNLSSEFERVKKTYYAKIRELLEKLGVLERAKG
jgi:hypothetical protein